MNVKLVAIAKDEAAYLSEWVFHHLYFGFDEIDVYINFTSDRSEEILTNISKRYPVNLFYAENLILAESLEYDCFLSERFLNYNKLQARAYSDALKRTLNEGSYSHIMFLDIDEFWTPVCFHKSIKSVLSDLLSPSVASFYWKNKVSENEIFQRPYQDAVYYLDDPHYKTIIKVSSEITIMNTHRSLHKSEIELLGDRYNEDTLSGNNEYAFILHRFQRHEIEYISMLGRGDPTSPHNFSLKFTRNGFQRPDNPSLVFFENNLVKKYDTQYKEFVELNELNNMIEDGREFVIERKNKVINYINEQLELCKMIKKVTPGVTLLDETVK